MNYWNRPVQFDGTKEEREANYQTHHWVNDGDSGRCMECDSKPWHTHANWPCGAEAPRENVPLANLYQNGELDD